MPRVIKPVIEAAPSLPEAKKPTRGKPNFNPSQLFGFDTETTRCGKKSIRSSQFAYLFDGKMRIDILALVGWFDESPATCKSRVEGYLKHNIKFNVQYFDDEESLRYASQKKYESLLYGTQPRVKRNSKGKMKNVSRKLRKCGVAFNANFDLGVLSDRTIMHDEMNMGGMIGAGVEYRFDSAYEKGKDEEYGLRIKALYLGAKSMPYCAKRGEVWDIQPLARELWNCPNLKSVGERLGLPKLVDEGETSMTYAAMDAVITYRAAVKLTLDLERMGFQGNPDRFISGATVSKDMMGRFYTPFYLTEQQHQFAWRAYFGGMTGACDIGVIRRPLSNLVYGDLDGAYNASGQLLEVFKWSGVEWISANECQIIIKELQDDPSLYWKYGSLHIEVDGDFDNVPLRVGVCAEGSTPTKSQGLVWASVENYRTVMSIGDYLHSRPKNHIIHRGLMATPERNDNPCLFKMTDIERKKFPKKDENGVIEENLVPNQWWKLAGNCLYGSFANRNGREREESGKWFNAIIASSITGAIRHCMWVVNESSDAYYNDTDSGLTSPEGFERAVKALEPLNIGFSNKTSDELPDCDVAKAGVVQGSKRYALIAHDGTFGAKCHGLGSWYVNVKGRSMSVAHNHAILQAVWQMNYPEIFGMPNEELLDLPVFHKFSIKNKKISNMVKEYARRQWDISLLDIEAHGKAGNFGYLSPSKPVAGSKQTVVLVSFEVEDAEANSDYTLREVAYLWGKANDKKYDYVNLKRWHFDATDISIAKPNELRVEGVNDDGGLLGFNSRGLKR